MPGPLPHSPADILRKLLVVMGHGTLPADGGIWPINVDNEPPSPDNCITIYNTAGTQQGRTQFDGERQEHHGVQVRVRSQLSPEGYAKARQIAVALDTDVYQDTILVSEYGAPQSYLVHSITRVGDVAVLGKEAPDSSRRLFTVNGLMSVRQT